MTRGTLLLVDDDEDLLDALGKRFRAEGFDVLTAGDGTEALTSFERNLPDVVVMDVGMPRLDGLAALRALRELNPRVYVIIISGDARQAQAETAIGREAADFLTKPLDLARLDRSVQAGMLRPKV